MTVPITLICTCRSLLQPKQDRQSLASPEGLIDASLENLDCEVKFHECTWCQARLRHARHSSPDNDCSRERMGPHSPEPTAESSAPFMMVDERLQKNGGTTIR